MSDIRLSPLHPDVPLPVRATPHAAGYDLRAWLTGSAVEVRTGTEVVHRATNPTADDAGQRPCVELAPGETAKIPLGFRSQLPYDVEAQIRPRSGTSFKTDLVLPNAPGTIDADYRGEWMVLVRNAGSGALRIRHGDAIAQVVFARVLHLPIEVALLDPSERGEGGFGSTGG